MRSGVLCFLSLYAACFFAVPCAFAAFGFQTPSSLIPDAPPPDNAADIPTLVMSDWGNAVAAWESTTADNSVDILYADSSDYGATWSTPAPLRAVTGDGTSSNHAPSLATDGAGNWIAAYAAWTEFPFAVKYTITVTHSTDDGATWTDPISVASVTLPKPDAQWSAVTPSVATDRAGNWLLTWDGIDPAAQAPNDSDIVAARSSDVGETWDTPSLVNPANNFLFDTSPRVLPIGSASWLAIWRTASSAIANTRIVTANSNDGGQTWSAPNTVPSVGGDYAFLTDVATDRKGTLVATLYQVGLFGATTKVQAIRSADNGATWESPDRLNPDVKVNIDAFRPALATDRNGNWLAFWWAKSGPDSQIQCSHSADNGATWSLPTLLDDTAFNELPVLGRPCIAASITGRWVAAWPTAKAITKTSFEPAAMYSSTSAFTERDDLFLLTPNQPVVVLPESVVPIRWFSTGSPGAHVRIELLRDATLNAVIVFSTDNDGAYNWQVSKKLRGKGYKIRIVSEENPACSDRSDKRFSVRQTP